jgi:uncharacterized protein YecT (DUF1311 family)
MKTAFFFALALLAPSFAHATDVNQIEKEWNSCLEKEENQNTMGMVMCNMEALQSADDELNKAYKSIMEEYKGSEKDFTEIRNRLRNAQRAWINFRDTDCQLKGIDMLGGTGERVIVSGCHASTTIQRVKDLKELFGR